MASTKTRRYKENGYEIVATVNGPDPEMVAHIAEFMRRAMLIRARDIAGEKPRRKRCGCSGS